MKKPTNHQNRRGTVILTTWALMLVTYLSISSFAQAASSADPIQIAKAQDIPGRMHVGDCQRYADELFRRLDAAGIQAYKVSFDWESYKFNARARTGSHMIVVFKDSRGRYYGMDNMARRPVWLRGNSPAEWTEFFAGMDMGTGVSNSVASRAAQNADTFVASR